MSDEINHSTIKRVGPDSVAPETFERYGVARDEIETIWQHFKLWGRIAQYTRTLAKNPDEVRLKAKERYYCELCDKNVRVAVKYHHVRTKKHLLLQNALNKKIAELKEQQDTHEVSL